LPGNLRVCVSHPLQPSKRIKLSKCFVSLHVCLLLTTYLLVAIGRLGNFAGSRLGRQTIRGEGTICSAGLSFAGFTLTAEPFCGTNVLNFSCLGPVRYGLGSVFCVWAAYRYHPDSSTAMWSEYRSICREVHGEDIMRIPQTNAPQVFVLFHSIPALCPRRSAAWLIGRCCSEIVHGQLLGGKKLLLCYVNSVVTLFLRLSLSMNDTSSHRTNSDSACKGYRRTILSEWAKFALQPIIAAPSNCPALKKHSGRHHL
jgi:hypothetical protein